MKLSYIFEMVEHKDRHRIVADVRIPKSVPIGPTLRKIDAAIGQVLSLSDDDRGHNWSGEGVELEDGTKVTLCHRSYVLDGPVESEELKNGIEREHRNGVIVRYKYQEPEL